MPTYRYLHLDVFTSQPFTGNQLAVFPDAVGLDAALMQQIAREMAFSETTFVLPPEAPDTAARVRIFTPSVELPMAGHPTIGTTFALAHEQRLAPPQAAVTLGLGVGPTPVQLEWQAGRLHFAWMTQPTPMFGEPLRDTARLAAALGVAEDAIRATGLPAQVVSSGVPLLFVPLASRSAVNAAGVDRAALQRVYEGAGLPELPVFVFSLEPAGDDATVFSRMFAPSFGIAEDPATGAASGPLGAYLVAHGAVTVAQAAHMVSLQGVQMGRPSRVHIAIGTQEGRITDVRVGGQAVLVGEGQLYTDLAHSEGEE